MAERTPARHRRTRHTAQRRHSCWDIAALVAAVAGLIVAQRLRYLMAKVFPRATVRFVPSLPAPLPIADLLQSAHGELTGLGFEGPLWLVYDYDPPDAGHSRTHAVYRHPGELCLAWLMAPVDVQAPNRLLTYFTTCLADARVATSQPFDPYFEATATPEMPAQTIAAETAAEQFKEHLRWRQGLGAAPNPASLSRSEIVRQAASALNAQRERLIAQGRLRVDPRGHARPTAGFALKLLRVFQRRPRPPANRSAIPSTRLIALAQVVRQVQHAAPPVSTQWGLFGLSVALFAGVGAAFWDIQFALILLGVIAFHELGHYLAMRASGYRQVQMLLLPLVGGATLGVETAPSAAQRAWMSLMGPLPGVVAGWVLLILVLGAGGGQALNAVLMQAAILLLAVNYLNALPIPPLDGSHVVRALLPPRWAAAEAAFIAAACVLGAVGAFAAGLTLLAVLATLQLLQVRNVIHVAGAARRLRNGPLSPQPAPRAVRLKLAFDALERVAGPALNAPKRIGQAEEVLRLLDLRPLRWGQRVVLSVIYAGLFLAPAMVLVAGVASLDDTSRAADPAYLAEREAEAAGLRDASARLTLGELLQGLAAEPGAGAAAEERGAPEASIEAAQTRLGLPLPEDVRGLFRIANGVPDLAIGPVDQVSFASRIADTGMVHFAVNGQILVQTGADATSGRYELSADQAVKWLVLGKEADEGGQVVTDLGEPPAIPGLRLIHATPDGVEAHVDLQAWLRARWLTHRLATWDTARHERRLADARRELAGRDIARLVREFGRPGLLVRWLGGPPDWDGPASNAAIARAEERLGRRLPDDYRALLELHDGFPPMHLLPVSRLVQVSALGDEVDREAWEPDPTAEFMVMADNGPTGEKRRLTGEQVLECLVLGAFERPATDLSPHRLRPTVLWCADRTVSGASIVALTERKLYPSFTALMREHAARGRALKAPQG